MVVVSVAQVRAAKFSSKAAQDLDTVTVLVTDNLLAAALASLVALVDKIDRLLQVTMGQHGAQVQPAVEQMMAGRVQQAAAEYA
jgi:hypothetical protein